MLVSGQRQEGDIESQKVPVRNFTGKALPIPGNEIGFVQFSTFYNSTFFLGTRSVAVDIFCFP